MVVETGEWVGVRDAAHHSQPPKGPRTTPTKNDLALMSAVPRGRPCSKLEEPGLNSQATLLLYPGSALWFSILS